MRTVPCARCGTNIRPSGQWSLPPGQATCLPCRRAQFKLNRPHGMAGYAHGCRCDTCRQGLRDRYRRSYQPKPRAEKVCENCGGTFTAARPGVLTCSPECSAQRRKALVNAKRRATLPPTAACVVCGDEFPRQGHTKLCSEICRRKRAVAHSLNRKAKTREVFVAPVERERIFGRDKWRCYRCGCALSRTRTVPHPQAPTIDHLVPLTRGGTHEPANVRACCYRCNCIKGNRGGNEQLLLIG